MTGATIWARNDVRRGLTSLLIVALFVAIAGGAANANTARRAARLRRTQVIDLLRAD